MASRYIIYENTLTNIADAIRNLTYESQEMTPIEMAEKINDIQLGIPVDTNFGEHLDENWKWERPNQYPNLDNILIEDNEDVIYLTYDLRKTTGYGWIGLYIQNVVSNSYFIIQRGHLENNVFIADEAFRQSSNASSTRYFRQKLNETDGLVQLWRIRTEDKIIRWGFVTSAATTAASIQNNLQPCVEYRANLNNVTNFSSQISTNAGYLIEGTVWLEKVAISGGKTGVVTTLASMFSGCLNLQEIDFDNLDTSKWKVTTLAYAFANCRALRSLDLSTWDTELWSVTSLYQTFLWCCSLKEIKGIENFNTTNWGITTFYQAFANCHSLRNLDLSNWDGSEENWRVTSLTGIFQNCYALTKLDLTNWDTSNWAVANFSTSFQGCWSLKNLDFLADWDTSNWAVTTISSTFAYDYSLEEIKGLDDWDTSNWTVTAVASMFRECKSLKRVDLSKWDTSNFNVSTASNTNYFVSDNGIISLDLPDNFIKETLNYAPNFVQLQHYSGRYIDVSHTLSTAARLTHESLLSIFNKLSTTATAKTITIGQSNKLKLTAEEIAIATQKGWTVA